VRGTDIDGTKLYSLALDVAPLTTEIIKNSLNFLERGENLLQNGMFYILDQSIVRNRFLKLELRKRKIDFSEKCSAL